MKTTNLFFNNEQLHKFLTANDFQINLYTSYYKYYTSKRIPFSWARFLTLIYSDPKIYLVWENNRIVIDRADHDNLL